MVKLYNMFSNSLKLLFLPNKYQTKILCSLLDLQEEQEVEKQQ